MLKAPHCTFEQLRQILIHYGEASGYKIYMANSSIMGFNMAVSVKQTIIEQTSVPWVSKVKYLGIKIGTPMTMMELRELNLIPLVNAVQQQLRS